MWRHRLSHGGLALDVAIHQGYMLEMFLGPIDTIYAQSRQVWPTRVGPGPDGRDTEIPVESDDCFSAALLFESGVQGTWILHFAGARGLIRPTVQRAGGATGGRTTRCRW